jgi:hypothetical protein
VIVKPHVTPEDVAVSVAVAVAVPCGVKDHVKSSVVPASPKGPGIPPRVSAQVSTVVHEPVVSWQPAGAPWGPSRLTCPFASTVKVLKMVSRNSASELSVHPAGWFAISAVLMEVYVPIARTGHVPHSDAHWSVTQLVTSAVVSEQVPFSSGAQALWHEVSPAAHGQ